MIIGIGLFISLYMMVIISDANFMKYIVTVTGYIACLVFMFGIILFKETIQLKGKENKKDNKIPHQE